MTNLFVFITLKTTRIEHRLKSIALDYSNIVRVEIEHELDKKDLIIKYKDRRVIQDYMKTFRIPQDCHVRAYYRELNMNCMNRNAILLKIGMGISSTTNCAMKRYRIMSQCSWSL